MLGPRAANRRRRLRLFLQVWSVLGALLLFALVVDFVRFDLHSYALLIHFMDPQANGPVLDLETRDVKTEDATIPISGRFVTLFEPRDQTPKLAIAEPSGVVRARLYWPVGVRHPSGMVVVHGIHHLGMEEPRLVSFARAVAGSGLAVLTPQVDSLADYRVDASSIAVIGESAAWLDERLGNHRVTVNGISFAGGLSLLAATDPATRRTCARWC